MKEKIQSTQAIFDGRIVHLKVHDVLLPNGQSSKREIIYHQGAAGIVALDDDNNILLVRQYRLAAGQISLEIPAGLLEPDENPQATASRELQEETGYRPLEITPLGGLYVAPAGAT
ncbi:MAG: NUDIX hydrolase, partial [Chloroflexota bacterium]